MCLEEGLEGSLQFYSFPEIDAKKISSTNMSERPVREVRRRSRMIGVFPTIDSWVRLEPCDLREYSEDWRIDRSYTQSRLLGGSGGKLLRVAMDRSCGLNLTRP